MPSLLRGIVFSGPKTAIECNCRYLLFAMLLLVLVFNDVLVLGTWTCD